MSHGCGCACVLLMHDVCPVKHSELVAIYHPKSSIIRTSWWFSRGHERYVSTDSGTFAQMVVWHQPNPTLQRIIWDPMSNLFATTFSSTFHMNDWCSPTLWAIPVWKPIGSWWMALHRWSNFTTNCCEQWVLFKQRIQTYVQTCI